MSKNASVTYLVKQISRSGKQQTVGALLELIVVPPQIQSHLYSVVAERNMNLWRILILSYCIFSFRGNVPYYQSQHIYLAEGHGIDPGCSERVQSPSWPKIAWGSHRIMSFVSQEDHYYYTISKDLFLLYQCCILSPLPRSMEISYHWNNHCCSSGYHTTLCLPIDKVS